MRVNFDYIKEKFGKGADPLLFKPAFDLHLIQDLLRREKEGEDLRKSEQGRAFLFEISYNYNLFWNSGAIEERLKAREAQEGLSAKIEGFRAIPGLSDKELKEIVEQKFNRRWLYGNISAFRYVDEEKARAHYGIAGEAEGRGIQSVLTKGERQTVTLYRYPGINRERIIKTIAHEIGHHQDWEHNNRLPIHERLLFLREVTARFESENRMKSKYIDVDIPKEYTGKDPKEMFYRQVKEYWATIIERYTTNPEGLLNSHPADYLLASEWYERMTKDFAH